MIETVLLAGTGLTLFLSLLVVLYFRRHLRGILTDLCGTRERAAFWCAYSNVTIILLPLLCSLFGRPDGSQGLALGVFVTQIEWALIGLIAAVALLGLTIGLFVPRQPAAR